MSRSQQRDRTRRPLPLTCLANQSCGPPLREGDMSILHRRHLLAATAAAGTASQFVRVRPASAQQQRPITMVVAYAAGGGTDVAARGVAALPSPALGGQ